MTAVLVELARTTPGAPPSGFLPASALVDPPLEQDADYEMDKQDRAYIDSQIVTIQYWMCQLWAMVVALTGGGSTIVTPVRLTFSGSNPSGTQLVCAGQDQEFFFNQSSGQGTYPAPVGVADGQRFSATDNATGGSWGTHSPKISVTGGASIENSGALGTFSTTNTTLYGVNGNSVTYVYGKAENTWFVK